MTPGSCGEGDDGGGGVPSAGGEGARDQSLLDRLKALKPTAVSLDTAASTRQRSLGLPPLPKEDALSARLRQLRNSSASPEGSGSGRGEISGGVADGIGESGKAPSAPAPGRGAMLGPSIGAEGEKQSAGGTVSAVDEKDRGKDDSAPSGKKESGASNASAPPLQAAVEEDDYDDPESMLQTDGGFLEELLSEEQAAQPTTSASTGIGGGAFTLPLPPTAPPADAWSATSPDRVLALLAELQQRGRDEEALGGSGGLPSEEGKTDHPHAEDDDDSDGDDMRRAAADLLERAIDEAALPEPPSGLQGGGAAGGAPGAADDDDGDDGDLKLPSVPSALPSGRTAAAAGDDFESGVAARLAALRGLGAAAAATAPAPSSGGASSSSSLLDLPSAPTFKPSTRSPPAAAGSSGWRKTVGRQGYTDADAATWCVVCLDAATVRCEGCEGDVYCARCWGEMHSGPSAGYEERSHRGVLFVRGF